MKPALFASALLVALATFAPGAKSQGISPDSSVTAGDCSNGGSDCRTDRRSRRYNDCHRDVRTHRINGVMVRHRHVGDNCAVRKVSQGTSF